MHIGDIVGMFLGVEADFIGGAVGNAAAYAATSHPGSEAAGVMISPVILLGQFALTVVGPAKFAAPYVEGFIKHATLF